MKKQNTHTETWYWGGLETPWTQDVNWTYIERSENVRDRYEVYFSLFEVLRKKKKEMPRIKCHTPPPYFQNTPPLILPILLFLWEKNWTSTLWKNYGISKPLCKGRDVSPHNLYNFLLFSTDIWRTWHSEGYLVIVTISYSLIWFRIFFFFFSYLPNKILQMWKMPWHHNKGASLAYGIMKCSKVISYGSVKGWMQKTFTIEVIFQYLCSLWKCEVN